MRQTLARLLKMVAGYGLIQWSGPLLSFIFTPVITRILDPASYGIADYILSLGAAIGVVAQFGLPQALNAHFNDRPGDEGWKRRLISSTLILSLLIGIPLGFGLVALAPWLSQSSFGDGSYTWLFGLLGVTTGFGLTGAILTTAAQAALRVRWGMLLSLTTILVTVFGNVVYIIILRLNVAGMILTPVTVGICVGLLSLWLMRGMLGWPSRVLIGLMLHSGAVLLPAAMAAWVLQMIDRLFLIHYVTTTELGYYSIATKIAALLYVVMAPLYNAWTPVALAMQYDVLAPQRYAIMARYLAGVVLFAGLALGLFATEILIVLTRVAYLPAAVYVGFLAYQQILGAFSWMLITGGLAGKQLAAISWTTIGGAVVNVILNFILIPPYGVWGATIATVAGSAISPIILFIWLRQRYPVPYPVSQLLGALAVQVLLLILGMFVPPLYFPVRIAIKLVLLATLPVAYILLRIVTPFELQQGFQLLRIRLQTRPQSNE